MTDVDVLSSKEKRILKLFTVETVGFTLMTMGVAYIRSYSSLDTRWLLTIFVWIFGFLAASSAMALLLIRREILKRLEEHKS